jgi:hypothetical protein
MKLKTPIPMTVVVFRDGRSIPLTAMSSTTPPDLPVDYLGEAVVSALQEAAGEAAADGQNPDLSETFVVIRFRWPGATTIMGHN